MTSGCMPLTVTLRTLLPLRIQGIGFPLICYMFVNKEFCCILCAEVQVDALNGFETCSSQRYLWRLASSSICNISSCVKSNCLYSLGNLAYKYLGSWFPLREVGMKPTLCSYNKLILLVCFCCFSGCVFLVGVAASTLSVKFCLHWE